MGRFRYGTPPLDYEFDDRTLTHLRVVLTAKMRRNEDFLMSWREEIVNDPCGSLIPSPWCSSLTDYLTTL